MHRVDTDGHQDNRFSKGDPAIGTQPTQLGEDWLNDVQENIASAVEAVLPLRKGDGQQLLQALRQCGHPGIAVERTATAGTFRANTEQKSYDDRFYAELSNGSDAGQTGLRVTSVGGKPAIQLWGMTAGTLTPLWRAGSDGSGSVSDARLKQDRGSVNPSDALKVVRMIAARWFSWKGDENEQLCCGFFAQQVVSSLREAKIPTEPFVSEMEGLLVPNRDALLALLFTAVGSIADSIDTLHAKRPIA